MLLRLALQSWRQSELLSPIFTLLFQPRHMITKLKAMLSRLPAIWRVHTAKFWPIDVNGSDLQDFRVPLKGRCALPTFFSFLLVVM